MQQLHERFALKDLGELHQFLGVEIISTRDGLFLSQHKHIRDILKNQNIDGGKEVSTPVIEWSAYTLSVKRLGAASIFGNDPSRHIICHKQTRTNIHAQPGHQMSIGKL